MMAGNFFTIVHNTPEVIAQLDRAPRAVSESLGRAMGAGATQVTRTAREKAPKAETELTNSIQPERITLLEWHVRAAKDYASYAEDGTKPGGRPSLSRMQRWIARKGIVPRTPGMTLRSLAHLMRQSIAAHGIPSQPYMKPALETNRGSLEARFRAAVAGGLASIDQGRAL